MPSGAFSPLRRIPGLLPPPLWNLGRFVYAVGRRFIADECLTRAAALAYVTLLSLVPLLALMFAVLKGLGAQRRLEPLLLSRFALDPETVQQVIGYIDQTNVGTLGGLGAAALVFTVVSVLGSVEASFNHIWRVRRGRSYWRKLTDYSGVVLLTPLLLLAAVAVTSSLQEQALLQLVVRTEYIGSAVVQALQLLPVAINTVALAVLYVVMTNRRPYLPGIVVGAVFAGALWHGVQWVYVAFQIGVSRYSAIYGALSQLPITLVWLYLSAIIVLAGAELAAVYEFGTDASDIGSQPVPAWVIGAHLLVRAAECFRRGEGAIDARAVARELPAEADAVLAIAEQLRHQGTLAAVAETGSAYVLARDPRIIVLADIDDSVAATPALPPGCDRRVVALASRFASEQRGAQQRVSLEDLVNGAESSDRESPAPRSA